MSSTGYDDTLYRDWMDGIIFGQSGNYLFFVPVHRGISCVIFPPVINANGLRFGQWISAKLRLSEHAYKPNIRAKHAVEFARIIPPLLDTRVENKCITLRVSATYHDTKMFKGRNFNRLKNDKLGFLMDLDQKVPDCVRDGARAMVELKITLSPADKKSTIFVVINFLGFDDSYQTGNESNDDCDIIEGSGKFEKDGRNRYVVISENFSHPLDVDENLFKPFCAWRMSVENLIGLEVRFTASCFHDTVTGEIRGRVKEVIKLIDNSGNTFDRQCELSKNTAASQQIGSTTTPQPSPKYTSLFSSDGVYPSDEEYAADDSEIDVDVSPPLSTSSTASSTVTAEVDDALGLNNIPVTKSREYAASKLFMLLQLQWLDGKFRNFLAEYDGGIFRKIEGLLINDDQ